MTAGHSTIENENSLLLEAHQIAYEYSIENRNGNQDEHIRAILQRTAGLADKVMRGEVSSEGSKLIRETLEVSGVIPKLLPATQDFWGDWLVNASELLSKEPEPIRWLVKDLWTDESCGFIGAEPKTGKTWLALEMALCIVTGKSVLDKFAVPSSGTALYIAEEGKAEDLRRRLYQLATGKGIVKENLKNLHLAIQKGVRIDTPEWQQTIIDSCQTYNPRAIFIDPFVRVHSANEDRAQELQPILYFLRRLQVDFHCSVILIHHQRKPKDEDKSRSGQKLRGSGDLYAWLDSALYLEKAKGDETVSVQVEHRDAGEPEPFLFNLEVNESVAKLVYQEGTLEGLKVLDMVNEMVEVVRSKPITEGITNQELMGAVKGKSERKAQALKKAEEIEKLVKATKKRPDKKGVMRDQTVWRISDAQPHSQFEGSR